jgi:hypothetical protein
MSKVVKLSVGNKVNVGTYAVQPVLIILGNNSSLVQQTSQGGTSFTMYRIGGSN